VDVMDGLKISPKQKKDDTSLSPEPTKKPTIDLNKEPISLNMEGSRTTFRGPPGLKERIDVLLREVALETGVSFTRNDFILNGIRFYIRYLLQARSGKDLLGRLKEEFRELDVPKTEGIVEEPTEAT